MDGVISVCDLEPGMGSQFTRIPLYGAHPVKRAWKDSPEPAVGWRCAILLQCQFEADSLARSGVHTQRYEGQEPRLWTIFWLSMTRWSIHGGEAAVVFAAVISRIPLERAPGEWVHSVASVHELPCALLARSASIGLDSEARQRIADDG